jgi:MFS transporter, ACDE family, multidrug resistance protein
MSLLDRASARVRRPTSCTVVRTFETAYMHNSRPPCVEQRAGHSRLSIVHDEEPPDIGSWTLGGLFLLATFPRALLISLLPILALRMLGSAESVSIFYACISALGIAVSICIPVMCRRLGAAGLLMAGAGAMAVAGVVLMFDGLAVLAGGMALYLFGYAAMEIALTLFVLKIVPRSQLTYFEPRRVLFVVTSYAIGPWLGITLENQVAHWAPFAVTSAAALLMVVVVPCLRLHKIDAASAARSGNPLRYLRRFFSQPRLRLAWCITLGRASWWTMFFIYAPLYAVASGLGEVVGGAIVSLGVAVVWTVPLWARIGRRVGLRRMLSVSFLACAAAMFATGALSDTPWMATVALLIGACLVAPLDAGGNIPFLRAVRARERSEMTGVFATYRDTAQLLPPAVFSLVLQAFALPAVFVTSGIAMLGFGVLARFLPRRL